MVVNTMVRWRIFNIIFGMWWWWVWGLASLWNNAVIWPLDDAMYIIICDMIYCYCVWIMINNSSYNLLECDLFYAKYNANNRTFQSCQIKLTLWQKTLLNLHRHVHFYLIITINVYTYIHTHQNPQNYSLNNYIGYLWNNINACWECNYCKRTHSPLMDVLFNYNWKNDNLPKLGLDLD